MIIGTHIQVGHGDIVIPAIHGDILIIHGHTHTIPAFGIPIGLTMVGTIRGIMDGAGHVVTIHILIMVIITIIIHHIIDLPLLVHIARIILQVHIAREEMDQ